MYVMRPAGASPLAAPAPRAYGVRCAQASAAPLPSGKQGDVFDSLYSVCFPSVEVEGCTCDKSMFQNGDRNWDWSFVPIHHIVPGYFDFCNTPTAHCPLGFFLSRLLT